MLKKLMAMLMCGFALFGCATLSKLFDENKAASRLVIQYATLKYINEDAERAADVVQIVDQALATLGDTPETALGNLKEIVDAAIAQAGLDSAERLLFTDLTDVVFQEIVKRLPDADAPIPVDEVKEVFGWMREAALLIEPQP